MSMVVDHVEIEFIMLADKAEFINGKLYMMGGLFDRLAIRDLKDPPTATIVVGVAVPWALTNQEHSIKLHFETQDGEIVGREASAQLSMARPINSIQGQVFRAVLTPSVRIKFPAYGAYRVVAEGPGGHKKSATFYVLKSVTDSKIPSSHEEAT